VQTYHRLGQLTRNETITTSGNRSQVVSNYLTLSAEAFDLCLSKPCVSSSSSCPTTIHTWFMRSQLVRVS